MERNHNTPGPPGSDLRLLFRAHSILTLEELKSALGTQVAMTVFRKLRPLGYLSSYSHRGKYYTLNEMLASTNSDCGPTTKSASPATAP